MIGEDAMKKEETVDAVEYGNYTTALNLFELKYSVDEVAQQLGYTSKKLLEIINKFDPDVEDEPKSVQ